MGAAKLAAAASYSMMLWTCAACAFSSKHCSWCCLALLLCCCLLNSCSDACTPGVCTPCGARRQHVLLSCLTCKLMHPLLLLLLQQLPPVPLQRVQLVHLLRL
jgi:hypothetical protein